MRLVGDVAVVGERYEYIAAERQNRYEQYAQNGQSEHGDMITVVKRIAKLLLRV